MAGLREVAELAGVSVSTVSRFLAGKLAVKSETEAAIRKAIEEFQYQPNLVARSLREGTTRTIGVVVPNVHNPLFSEMTRGMLDVFEQCSYFYFFFPSLSRLDSEKSFCKTLAQKRFDGAIFLSRPKDGDPEERHVFDLMKLGIKVVFLNRAFGTLPVCEIYADHQFGTYAATSHLLSQGRRRIGFLLGRDRSHLDSIVRLRGYRQALYEAGQQVDNELVLEANWTFEDALARCPALLAKRVDGLVCANDLMAAGALKSIVCSGFKVPEDVAVVGYGDTGVSQMVTPELTSVFQNSVGIGQRAAEVLLALLNGAETKTVQECIPVSLRIRASAPVGSSVGD